MLHSKFNIYKNGWLDLVFADRNQAYGAYVLRKEYERTLTKALIFTLTIISSLLILLHFKIPLPAPIENTAAAPRPAGTLLKVTLVELLPKKQEVQPSPAVKSKPPKMETQKRVYNAAGSACYAGQRRNAFYG